MKLNIESFRICVMLERGNGSFDRPHMLTGKRPIALPFFAAAVYVGIIAYLIKDQRLYFLSRLWQKYPCVRSLSILRSYTYANIEV